MRDEESRRRAKKLIYGTLLAFSPLDDEFTSQLHWGLVISASEDTLEQGYFDVQVGECYSAVRVSLTNGYFDVQVGVLW